MTPLLSKRTRALLAAGDWDALRASQPPTKPRKAIKRGAWMKRGTKPLPAINADRQKKRRAAYKKALTSKHWKALRAQVYAEQGGLCVCGQEPMTILDHLHYQRLGHELRSDVQGLGDVCNARETTQKRGNWMGDRRGTR